MNTPTTLYTTLFAAAIPAIISPALACPFCHKYAPDDIAIDWSGEIVLQADDDFIRLFRPLVTGTVRAAQMDKDGFPENSLICVWDGWEDEPPSVSTAPGGNSLYFHLHESHKTETMARIERALQRLTVNGKLRPVHMSELETVLSEELEYEPLRWQKLTISTPPELAATAAILAERLRPITSGVVQVADKATDGMEIRLSAHRAPAQATAIAKDNCILLCINPEEDIPTNLAGFLKALQEISQEEQAPLSSVSEKRLNRHFHEACRTHIIDWQHIVLPAELGEDVADWFRKHAGAKVDFYSSENTPLELTRHSLRVKLIHGGRNKELNAWTDMRVGTTHIPTLTLAVAPPSNGAASDTEYLKATALQLLEWLRPLMKDGKLPPIPVEELQKHLNTTRHPLRRP